MTRRVEPRAPGRPSPQAIASGFNDESLRAQENDAGVRELIFKPEAVEVFCNAVQRLVRASGSGAA